MFICVDFVRHQKTSGCVTYQYLKRVLPATALYTNRLGKCPVVRLRLSYCSAERKNLTVTSNVGAMTQSLNLIFCVCSWQKEKSLG